MSSIDQNNFNTFIADARESVEEICCYHEETCSEIFVSLFTACLLRNEMLHFLPSSFKVSEILRPLPGRFGSLPDRHAIFFHWNCIVKQQASNCWRESVSVSENCFYVGWCKFYYFTCFSMQWGCAINVFHLKSTAYGAVYWLKSEGSWQGWRDGWMDKVDDSTTTAKVNKKIKFFVNPSWRWPNERATSIVAATKARQRTRENNRSQASGLPLARGRAEDKRRKNLFFTTNSSSTQG